MAVITRSSMSVLFSVGLSLILYSPVVALGQDQQGRGGQQGQGQQGGQQGGRGGQQGQNGQQGGQSTQGSTADLDGAIIGYVVKKGTGEALPEARVTLQREQGGRNRGGGGAAAVTDSRGRFLIANITPGEYRLEAEHDGFVDQEYGQVRPSGPGTILTVMPGQTMTDVVIGMVPTGAITGRVYDENGRPLEGVEVRAMRYEYDDGVRTLDEVQDTETDDLGEYRLYWLEPGEYFVSATFDSNRQRITQLADALQRALPQPEDLLAGRGGIADAIRSQGGGLESLLLGIGDQEQVIPELYVDTYFPGTHDASQASSITVVPDSSIGPINFTVRPTPAVTISGQVVGPFSGQEGLRTSVTIVPRANLLTTTGNGRNSGFGGGRGDDPDGSFTLSGVAPGSYTLVATMESRQRGGRGRNNNDDERLEMSGVRNIEVGSENLEGIVIQVQPAVTINGQVFIDESAAELNVDNLRVRLEPPREVPLDSPDARVDDDGRFVIEEVSQTNYRVSLTGLSGNYYLVRALVGGTDVMANGLHASGGLAPLQFYISGEGGSLQGTLDIPSDVEFSGAAQVVLVPQDPNRKDLYKATSADQNGQFTLQGIAPGRYTVYAWEDIPSGAYLDPVYVNRYRNRGFAVDIRKADQAQARPRLIPAGS